MAPIFRERFGLAFPVGHRFEQRNTLHVTDVRGENYLSRISCEYRDYLGELCSQHGVAIRRAYRSEREDWIMAMVAAGMGICFLPEFSAIHPGVRHRLVAEPRGGSGGLARLRCGPHILPRRFGIRQSRP